ncbi:MAG TPA: hypothetical protein P5262_01005 [Candidatus Moranbacteria bacterium]|nr:hypothetical protein [Candidatus Moranbacteria bacterium]
MNEKQLKEVNNGNNLRIREEDVSADDEDSGEKIAEWLVAGLALGFVIVVSGFFIWNKYYQKDKEVSSLRSQIENLQKTDEKTGEKQISNENTAVPEEAAADAYPGWKTYANSEIGYALRYPADWNLKETDGISEVTEANVKNITIDTPDKKYFLHFGLKGKNDSFYISDRTGVGAGEIKKIGTLTVLDTDVKVEQLLYEGKIHEIFFGAVNSSKTADGEYIFGANFGSREDTYGGPGIDPNLSYIKTTEKILESVTLINKTSAGLDDCPLALTDEDKLNMKGWETFTNNKYGFSLMYPNDWKIKNSNSNNLVMGDKGEAMTFQIKSDMAAFGLENYKLGPKKTVKIACKNTTVTTYIANPEIDPSFSGNERLVLTSFEKNGTAHTIFFSYKDIGASLSSDIVEQFDLILKSIKYVQ